MASLVLLKFSNNSNSRAYGTKFFTSSLQSAHILEFGNKQFKN